MICKEHQFRHQLSQLDVAGHVRVERCNNCTALRILQRPNPDEHTAGKVTYETIVDRGATGVYIKDSPI